MKNEEKNTKANAKPKALKVETKFPRAEIMANPSAFGVADYVLVGAMADLDESEYSRNQVLEAIEKFKKKKVKQQ